MKSLLFSTNTQRHSFSKDLEEEKQKSSRVISLLGALLFTIYTAIDVFALPKETLEIIVPLRIATISFLIMLFYITFKPIFLKEYLKIHLVAYYTCGVSISIAVYLQQADFYSYNSYFATFLVLFATLFSWSYIPLKQSILMSLVFVLIYSMIKLFVHKSTQGTEFFTLVSHLFYLSSSIIILSISQGIRDSLIFSNLYLQKDLKDLVHKKTAEAQKNKELANIDELTGIPNLRAIKQKLNKALNKEEATELTLVFIDLNGFKTINDTYGHDSGDSVLKTTAERLKEIIRKNDYLARIGGDEFLLIFQASNEGDKFINGLSNDIKTIVAAPIAYHGNILRVGVSVGYANYPEDGKTIEELIKIADKAMYEDKQLNKNNLKSLSKSRSA